MALFIVLTAEQAELVRGPSVTSPCASLDPIEYQAGIFILGADVLTDSAHEAHREFLAGLPQLDDADPGFPPRAGGHDE